jgi:hypothetical protein
MDYQVKITALILALLCLLNFPFTREVSAQEQVTDHWVENHIPDWMTQKLIQNQEVGAFNIDQNLTRAEFIALLNMFLGFTENQLAILNPPLNALIQINGNFAKLSLASLDLVKDAQIELLKAFGQVYVTGQGVIVETISREAEINIQETTGSKNRTAQRKSSSMSHSKNQNNSSQVAVDSIVLTPKNLILEIGQSATIKAEIKPQNATNKRITWLSSNQEVVTVDQTGEVTPRAQGMAFIRAITEDGGKFDECLVQVVDTLDALAEALGIINNTQDPRELKILIAEKADILGLELEKYDELNELISLLFLQYLIDNRPASGYTAEDLRVIFKELVGLEEISIPKEFTVNSREELLSALELPEVEKITFASDLSTAEGIVIKRPIVILGNNKRIDFVGDVEGWQGNCIFTIYEVTDVVIADIKLTGADGAIFVHNSEVKLEGTINLSDNEFGGIKLGQITSDKTCLDVTEAQILTNEVYGVPALWKSYDDEEYIKGGNFNKILYGEKIHYYLSPKISPVTTIKAKNEADAIVAIDNQQNLIQKAKGKTFRDIRKALESTDWSKQTYQFLYSHGDKVTNEYDYAGNGSRLIVTSEDGSREAIYTITVNPIN